MADFLFTWKPSEKYPYEEMRDLADRFKREGSLVEPWRSGSHKMVREGDRAYAYKQGRGACGIYAVGTIDGPVQQRKEVVPGEGDHEVPVKFDIFVDPRESILVSKNQLLEFHPPVRKTLHTEKSGVPLESAVARMIDRSAFSERP
jgi:hypothetical protein